eukprot:scpid92728/ scgid6951/ 
MAVPFYFEETSDDRILSLVRWRICPIYPDIVPADTPNVQALVRHINDIPLNAQEGQIGSGNWRKSNETKDVFLKCSYVFCKDIKAVYESLTEAIRADCCPFVYAKSQEELKEMASCSSGFVFLLHNHNTTATILPKVKPGSVAPQCSLTSVSQ